MSEKNEKKFWFEICVGRWTTGDWLIIILTWILFTILGMATYHWQFCGGQERAEAKKKSCEHCVCVPEPKYP